MDGSQALNHQLADLSVALPVPVCAILKLAIHGLAKRAGFIEQGVPALPARTAYLPCLILLLHRHDWRQGMAALIQHGLEHDPARAEMAEMMQRALTTPGLHRGLVEELARLAGRN